MSQTAFVTIFAIALAATALFSPSSLPPPGGITLPAKFSGANCRFAASTGDLGIVVPQLMSSKLTIECDGETLVRTRDYSSMNPAERPTTDTYYVRFASTHFDDGETFTVKYECVGVNGTTYGPVQGTSVIYNKSLIMATLFESGNGGIVPDPPGVNAIVNMATCGEADGHLLSCNITRLVGSPTEYAVGDSDFSTNLPLSNLLFIATHGDNGGFKNSFNTHHYSWTTLASLVSTGQITPPYLTVSYACDTSPGYFITPWGLTALCEGAAGFDEDIKTLARFTGTNVETTIQDHAHILMDSLERGMTLKESVDLANNYCQPVSLQDTDEEVEMTHSGDEDTRIKWVYLTSAEKATMSKGDINKWYYITP